MSKNKESEEYNKHFSNVAKQTSINFIGRIAQLVFSFVTSILLARVLGPGLLGQYNLGNTVANFTANFTKIGFDQGLVRFIPLYKTNNKPGKIKYLVIFSFLISAILSILIGSIFYFYSDFLALKLFNDIEMSGVLKITSVLIFVFTYYRLSISVLKGIKRVDFFTIISSIVVPITFLLSLLILRQADVYTVISARMISYVIGITMTIIFVLKKEKIMIGEIKKINLKEYFGFSSPLLFIGLLYFLISHIDILMIGHFLESADVGVYSVAVRIAGMAVFLLSASNTIFGPTISELTEKKQFNTLERLLKSISKIIFAFSLNFLLFVIIYNQEILTVFGKEYLVGGVVLMILTFGQFINASVGPTGTILIMSGKQKFEVFNSIAICIMNTILNLILIPRLGILGAAIATTSSIIIINIFKVLEVFILYKFHPYKKSFLKLILFSMVSGIVIFLCRDLNIHYITKLLLAVTFSMLINFGLIYKYGLEEDDQFILDKIINKFK
ncbi:oligosaccharide flippase family protein [Halanaerobium kushneri]|uniref:Membrane protein involved in the export of O-antigen and teichoic acid n=1 Tax=Halanaerobium kushneri TaxID=56779 RepID=A0A1N7BY98_9FIRM|nr:oligosaccharide flippase family protein [Halanaerobium kushneri]SIR56341.1 Membrane protein involved in the export of O-antigen and teichoic acid [Halanaerobium kushneri]